MSRGVLRVDAVELIRVRLPFLTPFRSALGNEAAREALLVHVLTDGADGWGECAAPSRPLYSEEHVDGAYAQLRDRLAPLLVGAGRIEPRDVSRVLDAVAGNPMAKAAIEMAVLDASLREDGVSMARFLGGERAAVECGIALGIDTEIEPLLDAVERRAAEGYRRIKLKIAPGWDVRPVAAVRERFGAALPLSVDANGAYTLADLDVLSRLDAYGLAMLEEPLGGRSLAAHAELAQRLRVPICLDESIPSAEAAAQAIERRAAGIVNVKPGRVGGLLEAVRVHEVCRRAGVPIWCGGMFETGIGRAANLALASLPGFSLPADISPTGRHYPVEITTPPAVMREGCIPVPEGPGLGVDVDRGAVDSLALSCDLVRG